MKCTLFVVNLLVLHSYFVCLAQTKEYNSVLTVYEEGTEFYRMGFYTKGYDKFMEVNVNDTAYFDAMINAMQCLWAENRYDSVVTVCRKALSAYKYNPSKQNFINSLGHALIQRKQYDEALAVLDSGIAEFPKNYLFHYNKSTILYEKGLFNEAFAELEQTIRYNPGYFAAHYQVGKMCYEAGDLTKAALAFNMAIYLKATNESVQHSIGVLEKLYSGEPAEKSIKLAYREDENYEDIDLLIKNKVALNPNYKFKCPIKYDFVKHNHLLFSSVKYDAGSRGFWNQHYIRFFAKVMDDGQFANLSLYQAVTINTPAVQSAVGKAMKKLKAFAISSAGDFVTFMNERFIWENGRYTKNKLIHIGDYGFDKEVETVNSVQVGPYTAYTNRGLIENQGLLNEDGRLTGVWKYYNTDGQLETEATFENSVLKGRRTTFYLNGSKSTEMNIENMAITGEFYQFYNCNQPFSKMSYQTPGVRSGPGEYYHENGAVSAQFTYKNDLLDGEYTTWYADKAMKAKYYYADGKLSGEFKEYYRSGKLESEGQFTNDFRSGHWKFYHDNGALRTEGDYKDGLKIGVWKELSPEGKLSEVTDYGETGTKTGTYKEYDLDEKLILELEYKGADLTSYKSYDKTGKVLSEGVKTQKNLEFKGYYPDGTLRTVGSYFKSERTGTWKYYNEFGALKKEENYNDDGELEGKSTEYFPDGQVALEKYFKEGNLDGYFVEYHKNRKIYREGYFVEGDPVGEWKFYSADGTLSTSRYYLEGETHGEEIAYDCLGRISEISDYFYGTFEGVRFFDSTGKMMKNYTTKDGKADFEYLDCNGKLMRKVHFIGAAAWGETTSYHPNGQLSTTGGYVEDERHGEWKWYNEKGVMTCSGSYELGEQTGEWKWFYDDGTLELNETYDEGMQVGIEKRYYRDGKLESEKAYRMDERHGISTYYAPTGEVQFIRFFEDGVQLGYSYIGKDGQPVPMIKFNNTDGVIEAFFKSGTKSFYAEYRKGYNQGKMLYYFANGKVCQELNFDQDDYHGKQTEYYETGKVLYEENYTHGDLNGETREYYPNGKLKAVETYVFGDKHGWSLYYSSDGKLQRSVYFYDDREIFSK